MNPAISSAYRRLRIPDAERYWVEQVKCRVGCPVFTDACGYVTAVAEGRDEDAYAIARATNPFVSICGRICGAPCEAACRRGSVDAPGLDPCDQALGLRAARERDRHATSTTTGTRTRGCCVPKGNYPEKIAVIGSGVGGLTVAHDLARAGYKVTVFESNPVPGGMLTLGVPLYRLPRELVKAEIDAILSLGVELQPQRPGRASPGNTIADLRRQGYKAFFIGAGLQGSRRLEDPGRRPAGRRQRPRVPQAGEPRPADRRSGRASSSSGAATSRSTSPARRSGNRRERPRTPRPSASPPTSPARRPAGPASRRSTSPASSRAPRCRPTTSRSRRGSTRASRLHTSLGPRAVLGNGKVEGIEFVVVPLGLRLRAALQPEVRRERARDDRGRHRHLRDRPEGRVQLPDARGRHRADGPRPDQGRPRDAPDDSRPDVFAGGDVVLGPRLFIDAIASAQVAARSIHDYLRKIDDERRAPLRVVARRLPMAQDWEVDGAPAAALTRPDVRGARRAPPTGRWRRTTPRTRRAGRPSAACAATCRPTSRGSTASPATAASTSARTTASTSSGSRRSPPTRASSRWREEQLGITKEQLAAFEPLGARRPRRRHAEGRDRLHPLLDVRHAVPDEGVHDAALRVPPRARGRTGPEPPLRSTDDGTAGVDGTIHEAAATDPARVPGRLRAPSALRPPPLRLHDQPVLLLPPRDLAGRVDADLARADVRDVAHRRPRRSSSGASTAPTPAPRWSFRSSRTTSTRSRRSSYGRFLRVEEGPRCASCRSRCWRPSRSSSPSSSWRISRRCPRSPGASCVSTSARGSVDRGF